MDTLLQDLRFAVRTLVKAPLVSVLAIVCLALGIGANASMFSAFDGVLLKPFPFTDPDRIVVLTETNERNGIENGAMSYPNYLDVRERARTVTDVAAQTGRTLSVMDGVEAVRLRGTVVSWNLFDLLGARPALGRTFREDDDRPGAPGVIVLADSVWRTRYHSDAAIVGRTLIVNDAPHTVIGVMPAPFAFPEQSEAWLPLAPIHHAEPRSERLFRVYARLVPGASYEQAREDMRRIGQRLAAEHAANSGWSADALAFLPHPFGETRNTGLMIRADGDPTSILTQVRDEIRASDASMPVFQVLTMDEARERGYWQYRLFSWMFSIFGAIALALAAVGVYGVLAYSVSQRSHEIGVRMALGARGSDVVRMIAGHGLRLAALGVVIGAVGAAGVTQGLRSILFNVSATDPLSYLGVALFLMGVAMAAAWVPARRATSVDPIVALEASRTENSGLGTEFRVPSSQLEGVSQPFGAADRPLAKRSEQRSKPGSRAHERGLG